ncbi:RHS repeat-associated core domain-containing protein [Arenimonas caeni]
MQQRYYDPTIGRFLSVDPMASDMQNGWNFNRYNYAANNPYKFTDPDGRMIRGKFPFGQSEPWGRQRSGQSTLDDWRCRLTCLGEGGSSSEGGKEKKSENVFMNSRNAKLAAGVVRATLAGKKLASGVLSYKAALGLASTGAGGPAAVGVSAWGTVQIGMAKTQAENSSLLLTEAVRKLPSTSRTPRSCL